MLIFLISSSLTFIFARFLYNILCEKKPKRNVLEVPKMKNYKNYYIFKSDLIRYNERAYEEYLNESTKKDLPLLKKEEINNQYKFKL